MNQTERPIRTTASFVRLRRIVDRRLRAICDPEVTDARANADQAAMIEAYGGREAVLKLGAPGAAPAPLRRSGPADGGS